MSYLRSSMTALVDDVSDAGFSRASNYASVPLSRIRDLRFGAAGSPYRTSLHLPPSVEPRWMTVIYTVPTSSSSFLGGPAFKLVHFVANTQQDLQIVQETLEGFREGRIVRGFADASAGEPEPTAEEAGKVVYESEVHALCARLGMGMSKADITDAFRVGFSRVPWSNARH